MNDPYLQKIIDEENKRLDEHCQLTLQAYNKIGKDPLHCIIKCSIPTYKDVLLIEFKSGRKGYINISCNSVLASARELATYLYHGSDRVIGFIKEVY